MGRTREHHCTLSLPHPNAQLGELTCGPTQGYMMVQRELVILSVPSLCLPSVPSLWALLPEDPLEAFIPFSLVPFPESELVVFLVPKESLEFPRGTLTPEDTDGHGATARDGRIIRHDRALRMSCVVFRIISSTETLSALISAVFRASSNCVSKCFARCWSRLLSFSETPSWEREKRTLCQSKMTLCNHRGKNLVMPTLQRNSLYQQGSVYSEFDFR